MSHRRHTGNNNYSNSYNNAFCLKFFHPMNKRKHQTVQVFWKHVQLLETLQMYSGFCFLFKAKIIRLFQSAAVQWSHYCRNSGLFNSACWFRIVSVPNFDPLNAFSILFRWIIPAGCSSWEPSNQWRFSLIVLKIKSKATGLWSVAFTLFSRPGRLQNVHKHYSFVHSSQTYFLGFVSSCKTAFVLSPQATVRFLTAENTVIWEHTCTNKEWM